MGGEPDRKPLLRGRGAMRIEDFCRVSGLDQPAVEGLMRAGHLEGGLWRDEEQEHAFGLFDDALPSRDLLVALGLQVRDDYDPAEHRSVEVAEDEA